MFLNFKITNYRSVGKELTIDFGIKESQKLGTYAEINGQALNTIACLVGPNASGKSNILKGIAQFLNWTYQSYSSPSYRYKGDFTAHFCCKGSPTEFSTEFIDRNNQYKYEVSILDDVVQKEILQKRNETTKRYSCLFDRSADKNISFGKAVKINKQDLNRLGDDMSLISLMLELNYFDKNDFLIFENFNTNVYPRIGYFSQNPELKLNLISRILQNDSILLNELIEELKIIDTGISSLELKKTKREFKDPGSREIVFEQELSTILTKHI